MYREVRSPSLNIPAQKNYQNLDPFSTKDGTNQHQSTKISNQSNRASILSVDAAKTKAPTTEKLSLAKINQSGLSGAGMGVQSDKQLHK